MPDFARQAVISVVDASGPVLIFCNAGRFQNRTAGASIVAIEDIAKALLGIADKGDTTRRGSGSRQKAGQIERLSFG